MLAFLKSLDSLADKFIALKQKYSANVWRFVQVHVHKVIMFIIFICFTVYEVSLTQFIRDHTS